MIIEKVQDSNLDVIIEIDRQTLNSNWNKKTYLSYLSNHSSLFYIAKANDEIVGFIVFQIGEFQSDLMQIAVRKNVSHKGIGTTLLEKCIKRFSKNHEVFLEVDEENQGAIKFYEKNGFEKISIRKNYYDNGNNAIVYRKVI